jgi:hypothetical protein
MIRFSVEQSKLTGHVTEQSYVIGAIKPGDLLSTTGQQIDLKMLADEFKAQICPDFGLKIDMETASQALKFAHTIIYDVGPSSRGKKDKAWTFQFPADEKNDQIRTCTVLTLKTANQTLAAQTGLLTVKRATLLCMPVFNDAAVEIYYAGSGTVFTPLAAATFPVGSLKGLSELIMTDQAGTIKAINSSTCSGGHLLDDSNGLLAVTAAISAVQGKDAELAKGVVSKVVKQYAAANKLSADGLSKLASIAKFASGGVPIGFEFEKINELFKQGREVAVNVRALTQLKERSSVVNKAEVVNVNE